MLKRQVLLLVPKTDDEKYMQMALDLALKGEGRVNPNPLVGAVIVKDHKIIGSGWHQKFGGLHAERNALAAATESAEGATMYVTLEPCCHYGKTPPCTEAILERGIKRVVIGCLDPNPLMAGKGAAILRKNGLEVETDVLQRECEKINQVFFYYIKNKLPYVVMKYAMTLDGKIATVAEESRWVSGVEARLQTHRLRNKYAAIMVGIGTVLIDDPLLTCRIPEGRNPVRIICDTNLRTPLESKIVQTAAEVPTILATTRSEKEAAAYLEKGCQIITVPLSGNHIDLNYLMTELGKMGIDSILLEGGSTLNFSALEAGIVNKVQAFIAPKIFGGVSAKTPVGGWGIEKILECIRLENVNVEKFGKDILLEGDVMQNVHGIS